MVEKSSGKARQGYFTLPLYMGDVDMEAMTEDGMKPPMVEGHYPRVRLFKQAAATDSKIEKSSFTIDLDKAPVPIEHIDCGEELV